MKQILYLPRFKKEFLSFSAEVRTDFTCLIDRYLMGERLSNTQFKTFLIKKGVKVQEFKVKNKEGNWRAVSFVLESEKLIFIYAFHKKSQQLLVKDKKIIIKRIKEVKCE